jgi:hypothetical protein
MTTPWFWSFVTSSYPLKPHQRARRRSGSWEQWFPGDVAWEMLSDVDPLVHMRRFLCVNESRTKGSFCVNPPDLVEVNVSDLAYMLCGRRRVPFARSEEWYRVMGCWTELRPASDVRTWSCGHVSPFFGSQNAANQAKSIWNFVGRVQRRCLNVECF